MAGTPPGKAKWRADSHGRARAGSQRGWSTFTIKSKEVLLAFYVTVVRNSGKSESYAADHFFSLPLSPRKFPMEGTGAKLESK